MSKRPVFNEPELDRILADVFAVAEYRHEKTVKGDIRIETPCRCLGKLPKYQCVAILLREIIKHYRGDIPLDDVPELGLCL